MLSNKIKVDIDTDMEADEGRRVQYILRYSRWKEQEDELPNTVTLDQRK